MSDPLVRIDTTKLDAEFLGMLLGLLGAAKAHGLDLHATEGYRSPERSDELYKAWIASGKKGPRAAPAGKSAHNFGCAVDFLCYRMGVAVQSSQAEEYVDLEELAPRYGLKTLRHLNDGGHVELDGWEARAGVLGGHSTI